MLISPDKLFEEVSPWEREVYIKFIEKHVVPLNRLAIEYSKYFKGDPSAEAAAKVADASRKVIEIAKKKLREFKEEYTIPSKDPLEIGRELLEYAANMFLGVGETGKLTYFIYSCRHLPLEYLYALYPKLEKEEDTQKSVFMLLGITEIFTLKTGSESPLIERLKMIGYRDYPRYCYIETSGDYQKFRILSLEEESLGGRISRLIDAIAFLLKRPGLLSAYDLSIDVLKEYLTQASSLISIPQPYSDNEFWYHREEFASKYDKLSEGYLWERDYCNVIEGLSVKIVDKIYREKYESVKYETNVLTEFRQWSPLLALGVADILIGNVGKFIVYRWIKWG